MTRVGRGLIFGLFVALLATTGSAQDAESASTPPLPVFQPQPRIHVTEVEVRDALKDVEELNAHLQYELKSYQERLKQARERYGRGVNDPAYKQKLAPFAAMMNTAGVRLDPEPSRYWAEIEKDLARYDGLINKARDLMAWANVFDVKSKENIPNRVLKKFKSQWLAALKQAEKQRLRADAARPGLLRKNQILEERAINGPNLHFSVFGVEIGREMTNVGALARLARELFGYFNRIAVDAAPDRPWRKIEDNENGLPDTGMS